MSQEQWASNLRDMAALLGEGPDRAPSELLARSMARVAVTRQRPATVAMVLGAPVARGRSVTVMTARAWVAAALLLMAMILALVAIGSWRQRDLLMTVLPSVPPVVQPTSGPAPSRPLATNEPSSRPDEHAPFSAGQNIFVDWTAVNPWSKAVALPGGNPEFMADRLREVVFDECINLCTGRFVIDFIVGTIDEGLVYGWRPCPILTGGLECAIYQAEGGQGIKLTVEGTTTDELTAAWQDEFGEAERTQAQVVDDNQWQVLTYAGKSVALVARGSRLVAVTLVAQGGLPAEAVEATLERFLPAIRFGAEPNPGLLPPIAGSIGDLTLTMPRNFAMQVGLSSIFVNEDRGDGTLLVIDDRVTRLLPGGSMQIERRQGTATNHFVVTGSTLSDVKASIDAALESTASDLRIGDARGYRWHVIQTSVGHPLVAVAVIEWKGSFYVFEEHFPLDGSSAGNFDVLLQGVTLR